MRVRVRKTFHANGIGIFETATGWCRDPEHMRDRVTFKGQEHMERAMAQGKGALIVGIHFSTLDLGGALHSLFFPADASIARMTTRYLSSVHDARAQWHFRHRHRPS